MQTQKHSTLLYNILIKLKFIIKESFFLKIKGPLTLQAFTVKQEVLLTKNKNIQIICFYQNYSVLASLFILSINATIG